MTVTVRTDISPIELAAAIDRVCRMSNAEFAKAANDLGLVAKQAEAAIPRRQRTALVSVEPTGATFAAKCGWCGWSTRQRLTFHAAQLAAHRHNRHAHRDHCVVDARVA